MQITISINENGQPVVSTSSNSSRPRRPEKGKSLIDFPENFTAIDIETTGLDSEFCEIIEFAAIRYASGTAVDSFATLVKPEEPIDDFIAELTGITDEMVKDAPDIDTAILQFCDFIGSDILVGHNVNFDINFIYDVLQRCHGSALSNDFIDTMRLSRRLLPDLKNHKLPTVAAHYGISPDSSHRALSDCETCAACYLALKNDAIAQHGDIESFQKSCGRVSLHGRDIIANTDTFDENHPLYGKLCVFTGTLEKMPRKEAMQLVVNLGGKCGDGVTAKTNYLILGNNDFCSSIKSGKSSKQKKAESLMLKGKDIEIISENVFYDMVLNH